MSTYKINRITFGSPGIKTFNVGFQVAGYRITMSKTFNGANGYSHISRGGSNGTAQYCTPFCQTQSFGIQEDFSDRVINHYEAGPNNTFPVVVAATHDSITATSFSISMSLANGNYQMLVEYWD